MLIVVLDTNALHSDAWLTGQHGRALVDLASEGRIRLIVPEVVRDEILRQRREAAEKAWKSADEALDEMQKADLDVSESKARLKATFGRIDSEFDGAFAELFGRGGVSMGPKPAATPDCFERWRRIQEVLGRHRLDQARACSRHLERRRTSDLLRAMRSGGTGTMRRGKIFARGCGTRFRLPAQHVPRHILIVWR